MSFDEAETPHEYIAGWELLLGRKWNVQENAHVLFLAYAGEVIATRFFVINESSGEAEGNTAFTRKDHRQKGLWKYMTLKMLYLMKKRGAGVAIVTSRKPFLLPFYETLGFERVNGG